LSARACPGLAAWPRINAPRSFCAELTSLFS